MDPRYKGLGLNAYIVLIMHDVMVEAKAEDADYVKEMMEDCLPQAFKRIIQEVFFAVEARVAESWGSKVRLTFILIYDLPIKTNVGGE